MNPIKCHLLIFKRKRYLFVSFDSLHPSQRQDGSSWVEPVLSKDKCVLLKDTT